MAEEFPLPSSSYKELIKIIRAYGRIGTEASLGDVSKLAVMGETSVSGNNKFLIALGIIKAGQKKAITPLGAELAKALDHEMPDEIASKWRAVVNATDFLERVIAAVRIRKTMDEASLESHVAYSAGQPKTPAVATGARTVVDILITSGLLKEEDGTLIAVAPEPRPITETVDKTLSIADSPSNNLIFERGMARASTRLGGVQLNIDVTVQCTPADLQDLGHKLRKVLKDFNEPEVKQEAAPPQPTEPDPSAPPLPPAPASEVAEE
jgi:hypothetical protein